MELHSSRLSRARANVWRAGSVWAIVATLLLPTAFLASTFEASALSEIQREDLPAPSVTPVPQDDDMAPENAVPLPDPIQPAPPTVEQPADPAQEEPEQVSPDGEDGPGNMTRPANDPDAPIPEVIYDLGRLPEPVRRMRQLIVDAAKSGDIEKLRPLIGLGDDMTQLSLGAIEGDPIQFVKELSGDTGGQEILAIIEEVLSAGYVHLDAGTPSEIYVWPYFFAIPLDKLTAPQRVELFKIVTAGDYEDMKTYGTYIFYRIGITPEGQWSFFVAGD